MTKRYDKKIEDIREKISSLLQDITKASELSLEAFKDNSETKFKEVKSTLNRVKFRGDIIDNEVIKIFALYAPEAKELRFLVAFLKMTGEIVSVGEGIQKYAKRMREHLESGCDIEFFKPSITLLHKSSVNALRYISECFDKRDECNFDDTYRKVIIEESMNDDLFSVIEKEILNKIINEKEFSTQYVKILGTLRKLERSCDRSVTIANLMRYAQKGGEISTFN